MLLNIFHGFCMALADSVPGVSGGTVAYILGFYERFIGAIHALFSGTREGRAQAIRYLLKLGIGWGVGMISSMLVLSKLFESNIYFLTSLFLGLTIAAIPFVVAEERKFIVGQWSKLPYLLLGFGLVVGMVMLRGDSAGASLSYANLSLSHYIQLFISGFLAISAMVLPGVSGSTLLLIMGVYVPTVNAVSALFHLNFSVVSGLVALICGIILGAAVSVRLLKNALANHRSAVVYLILGLLLGSLGAITMGPTTLETPLPALSLDTFSILAFILGIIILIGLEQIKHHTIPKE